MFNSILEKAANFLGLETNKGSQPMITQEQAATTQALQDRLNIKIPMF